MTSGLCIKRGLPEPYLNAAVDLYWQAFGGHLGPVLGPKPRAFAFLTRALQPQQCISAFIGQDLVGILGFALNGESFAGGSVADMRAIYGPFGAAWRIPLLRRLGQAMPPNAFMIEGFTVTPKLRGHGIGAALLTEAIKTAQHMGGAHIYLDMEAGNLRARRFYETHGFDVVNQRDIGALRHVFGFSKVLHLRQESPA